MFKDIVNYKPLTQRTPDDQYKALLKDILEYGQRGKSQQEVDAITLIGAKPMRFRLDNGFPMITERNLSPVMKRLPVTIWQQAIGEICAFVNGARTTSELEEYGCYWWKYWCTKEKCEKRGLEAGDLGPGSYGAAFHDFPTSEGPTFNQFKYLVEQIKEKPHLRTHFITPWIPQYIYRLKGRQQKVVVCPCHGWIHIRVIDNRLTLHMFQRSGDAPIGVPSNMIQYAALTMMLAHVTGLKAYEYVHTISDAHIFVDQIPAVQKIISRDSKPFPTIKINTNKKNIFDFRREDFELTDYNPHPGIKGIPVAI